MAALDIIAVGRSGIDLYAEQVGVPFAKVRSFAAYVGGTPANIAVGLRRLGVRSALLTAVSDDPVGDFITRFLDDEGVETRFVRRKSGFKSGLVLLGIDSPDHFSRVHYRDNAADQHLTVQDVEAAAINGVRMIVVVGTSMTHAPGRDAALRAAELAKRSGAEVIVDLDYRSDLWPRADRFAEAVGGLLAHADVAIGTQEELNAAVPSAQGDAFKAASRLFDMGIEVIVEKRGELGCRVHRGNDDAMQVEGFRVQVTNPLGAGDAFAAGFLYGRLEGWDLGRCARFGNACGAIVVTRHACSDACPTLKEVDAFIQEHGGHG